MIFRRCGMKTLRLFNGEIMNKANPSSSILNCCFWYLTTKGPSQPFSQFARGQGDFAKYRPPDYRDDFIPGQQNRLQHNLVNIFGFNAIGCCNLEEDRVLNERSHKCKKVYFESNINNGNNLLFQMMISSRSQMESAKSTN